MSNQEAPTGAPSITTQEIEASIIEEHYFTAADGVRPITDHHESLNLLTFCVLVLDNGFTVSGESACVSAANFDAEIGKRVARSNAINKVWPLMGYALKKAIYEGKQ